MHFSLSWKKPSNVLPLNRTTTQLAVNLAFNLRLLYACKSWPETITKFHSNYFYNSFQTQCKSAPWTKKVFTKMENAPSLGCNLTGNVHIQYQHHQHPMSTIKTSFTSSPSAPQSTWSSFRSQPSWQAACYFGGHLRTLPPVSWSVLPSLIFQRPWLQNKCTVHDS